MKHLNEKKGEGLGVWSYFFGSLLAFTMSTLLSILVLTKGWGLEPLNWWWIIGGGVFGTAFVRLMVGKVLVRPSDNN